MQNGSWFEPDLARALVRRRQTSLSAVSSHAKGGEALLRRTLAPWRAHPQAHGAPVSVKGLPACYGTAYSCTVVQAAALQVALRRAGYCRRLKLLTPSLFYSFRSLYMATAPFRTRFTDDGFSAL